MMRFSDADTWPVTHRQATSSPRTHHGPGRSGDFEVILDLSRLLSRAFHPAPTGVDRVEMAYARTLSRRIPERLRFGLYHPTGSYGRISASAVERFLDATEARWESAGAEEPAHVTRSLGLRHCWLLLPRAIPRADRPRVLLQASPHHLDRPTQVAAKLAREKARLVCLVHDLIPISHPEYARPNGASRHARRLDSIETHAHGMLANSEATMDMVLAHRPSLRARPRRVAPLGVERRIAELRGSEVPQGAYFLCIGTIEPRKNHLLLLNLWRSIVATSPRGSAPKLLLVGRRGWENENILDMLDRCPSLKPVVQEHPQLADSALRPLLRGARALLMPSFTEGFGLPIAEALAAGVPVIASEIPAHREVGGAVPDYIDPLDGPGWRNAILDYGSPMSVRRQAQLDRMPTWQPTTWDSHIDIALALAEEVAAC